MKSTADAYRRDFPQKYLNPIRNKKSAGHFTVQRIFTWITSVILAGGGRLGRGYAVFCGCCGGRCFTVYGGGDGGSGSAGCGACSQSKNHHAHKQKYKQFLHD